MDTSAADIVFNQIFKASQLLIDDNESVEASDIAIRLLDNLKYERLPKENMGALNFLLSQIGLYPYVEARHQSFVDSIISETHRIAGMPNIIFHREQMRILQLLLSGKSVALSAPTSFGKSIIIDAFVHSVHPKTIVVIQPSLALVDETRRRMSKAFTGTYKIISSPEEVAGESNIFILTPERFSNRRDLEEIDFLFVDEFYKYQTNEREDRQPAFSLCLYQATARSKQVLFAAPYVDGVDFGPIWNQKIRFEKTNFRTVSTNNIDRADSESASAALLMDLLDCKHSQNLVFSSTPGSCTALALGMASKDIGIASELAIDVSDWLSNNYSQDWAVAKLLRNGVGVHHGRMPRSVAQMIIRLFNGGDISCLFCTSTLIEGVNTTAKNVFIFDKTINGRDSLDFFTLQNIRGRAGRMLQHYVGNVYTYFELPTPSTQEVVTEALKSPEDADPYVLFNMPTSEVTKSAKDKKLEVLGKTSLPSSIISQHGSLGLERLLSIRGAINDILNDNPNLLLWHDSPSSHEQYEVIGKIITANSRRFSGVKGPYQLIRALKKLHRSRSLGDFVRWFAKTFWPDNSEGVDHCFAFLRQCEYSIPSIMRAMEDILRELEPDLDFDYKSYANEVENWFRSPLVRHAEEVGMPFVITERFVNRYRDQTLEGLMSFIHRHAEAEGWGDDVEQFISEEVLQSFAPTVPIIRT